MNTMTITGTLTVINTIVIPINIKGIRTTKKSTRRSTRKSITKRNTRRKSTKSTRNTKRKNIPTITKNYLTSFQTSVILLKQQIKTGDIMIGNIILSIAFTFSSPSTASLDSVAIVTGYPKKHKIPLYKAKGYDPYLYSGSFPFRGIV